MKKIALIGKPNVGKSSLFNAIAKERIAITSDISGTTRDIRHREVKIGEKFAIILDTGGLDDSSTMFKNVRDMSLKAAKSSDIILFLVDGKFLPNDEDKKIFFALQKLGKEIVLIVNKIDNEKMAQNSWEFDIFGAKHTFYISVSHRIGIRKLLDWLDKRLPDKLQLTNDNNFEDFLNFTDYENNIIVPKKNEKLEDINIAIVGRVNVGKSSLLNSLLGEDRSVVSETAGTTIDPVDEKMVYKNTTLNFVDTAGLRKRSKILGIEKYALQRTRTMLEKADVILLVLDSSEEFKELDEKIANLVDEFSLGCIVVLNKWDKSLNGFKKSIEEIKDRFKFLSYAPIITVSALSNKRVHKINDIILNVYKNYCSKIPTSKLNETLKKAVIRHQVPSVNGQRIRIYYATQFASKPPKIALIMNKPKGLHFSYKRYIINQLRDEFELEGTPILIRARKKGEREEDIENIL